MIRHNLCPNPACGTNITGWSGSATPVRTASITGMVVSTGANATASGDITTVTGTVSPGQVISVSFQIKNNTAGTIGGGSQVFVGYTRSAGGNTFPESFNTAGLGVAGHVQDVSFTCAPAPALATGIFLVMINIVADIQVSAVLYEDTATPSTYFDGNFPSCTWDGAANNSTSTFDDTPVASTSGGNDVTQLVLLRLGMDL